tara:strand:+ start:1763 stop:2263 length:501 start_codon:yes stop_codon:yes gene_type:complete
MPKGLKKTSETVQISFTKGEDAANTFSQERIDLQLDVLNREVFVVTCVDFDLKPPDAIAGTSTVSQCSLSTTTRTSVGNLGDSNVIAAQRDDCGLGAAYTSSENPSAAVGAMLEYIGIIATNDFFVQIEGVANNNASFVHGRLYGYRAVANADIFAALTQSEILSG